MCGIVGLVDLDRIDLGNVASRMKRAIARIRPRGPDDQGTWYDAHAALGHTRLAVVDLTQAGHQPMTVGDLTVIYNGEIYNHAELRRELEASGHRFDGGSDTEVLLRGWQQWGEDLLGRIDGMFAFALWDGQNKRLVMARDRFGKKPLLYALKGRRLVFGSDLIAMERLEGTDHAVDPAALRLFFSLRFLPEPWSIAQGVDRLAPGDIAVFDAGGLQVRSWVVPETLPAYTSEAHAGEALAERFDRAVALRLVADVPVGAYLSGGVDSALVAAAMVRNASDVRTFTVGFADVPAYYDEREAAAGIADHLGTNHTAIEMSSDDALAAVEPLFDALDEPFADSSALPSFLLARETRKHVTVALSGDGGDEVFGGYRLYQGEFYADGYKKVPGLLRRTLIEPAVRLLPDDKGRGWTEKARRLRRFVDHAGKPGNERRAGLARLLSEKELDALLVHPADSAPSVEQVFASARPSGPDAVTAMLIGDQKTILPADMLVKVDRTSMANGLEVRSPFLDPAVVDCANAMPGAFKLKRGQGKAILAEAFAGRLPEEVFTRPKKGFELPIDRWLTGPLDDMVRRAIDAGRLKDRGLIRPELPQRWYDDLKNGRRDTSWQLWTLVAFQAWSERRDMGWPGS